MEKSEMIWISSKYKRKGYSYEEMRHGDDTYNATEEEKVKIGEYMTEYEDLGRIAFYEKVLLF